MLNKTVGHESCCVHVAIVGKLGPGIQDRASRRLFTKEILMPSAGKYPEPSQKVVSASASRYFIFWASAMMHFLMAQWGNAATEHMASLSLMKKLLIKCWLVLDPVGHCVLFRDCLPLEL